MCEVGVLMQVDFDDRRQDACTTVVASFARVAARVAVFALAHISSHTPP
jgi:hypothetical protein